MNWKMIENFVAQYSKCKSTFSGICRNMIKICLRLKGNGYCDKAIKHGNKTYLFPITITAIFVCSK